MKECAASIYNVLVIRALLLFTILLTVACTKDETVVHSKAATGTPEYAAPVKAPEWYPTPRPGSISSGVSVSQPTTGVQNPASFSTQYSGSSASDVARAPATTQQAGPANHWAPDHAANGYIWPSTVQARGNPQYSPWQNGQTFDTTTQRKTAPRARRPWGDEGDSYTPRQQSGQDVWQFQSPPAGRGALSVDQQTGWVPLAPVPPVWGRYPGYVW
jgi:hypothetical protein